MQQQVDVGGYRLYAEVEGSGSPTILLEAGAGCASDTWDPIWDQLTAMTRVVRYDRANLGQSDNAPGIRTAREMVAELGRLLSAVGVTGPFILVGHSFGGLVSRLFAAEFPADVVGVVLIDASHHDQARRGLAILPPEGPDEPEVVKGFRRFISDPNGVNSEGVSIVRSQEQVAATGTLGALPLAVLARSTATKWPADFPAELSDALERSWQEMQADLASLSSRATLRVAERSGHYIHHNEPELVVEAIRAVISQAR